MKLRFSFDEGETLKPGTRVRDVSGHGHYGVVRVSGGGHLRVVNKGVSGPYAQRRAAGFPCRGCGRAIIRVADSPALDAYKHPFSFGASIKVGPKQAPPGPDPNIVTKGSTIKGKYKLHLLGAKPRCVFAGARNRVVLTSPTPIDDRAWHRVVCLRNGRLHKLFVDGQVKDSARRFSGKIVSRDSFKVGGRAVGRHGGNDQFHGQLDNVFVRVTTA